MVDSGGGEAAERVGLSAEDVGSRGSQSGHGGQDGICTQHRGLHAAERYDWVYILSIFVFVFDLV